MVQVEFNVNDGFEEHFCTELPCTIEYGGLNSNKRRSYERLLRKLLMLPHRPAVIMLQTFDMSKRQASASFQSRISLFHMCRSFRPLIRQVVSHFCVSVPSGHRT